MEIIEIRKETLYHLGERLIAYRFPVTGIVLLLTLFMGYRALQIKMVSSFNDLLPYRHPFIQVHQKYADQYGGANNVTVMVEVKEGDIFTVETLTKIYEMTQAIDLVYGVNHNQIDSIGHRTTRYLRVRAGGTIETPPVMRVPPRTPEEAAEIKRVVHNSENIYGTLVSLDDKAALIRANFIEGRLDYKRIFDEINRLVVEPFQDDHHRIYIAGEPRLYGWIYHYGRQAWVIFIAATTLLWVFLYLYFGDWRGALRPTITGAVSALWGLGFMDLVGFAMDPLALVIPFFVTARAVSHSVQMHDRYYEEYMRNGWVKEKAIIAAFAELFVPTLSGIITDALGMLVIIVVPVPILQKIAIFASVWVATVAVSELLLNPIVYYYLRPPERENVERRERGIFKRMVWKASERVVSPRGCWVIVALWVGVFAIAATQWRYLIIGDPTAATPLLWLDSPYNEAHLRIQEKFGGVEPLIIVVEGKDKDALKDPHVLKTMEEFQEYLERDPEVGYSFSLADIIRTMGMAVNDLYPGWGVIPNDAYETAGLLFFYFSGSSPTETAKYVDASYRHSTTTFFCKNHRGETVRRIIKHCREFIAAHPMERATFRMAGGLIGVTAAANEEILRNDVLMNGLAFGTIFFILLVTYRSFVAPLVMLMSLFLANGVVNAYLGATEFGINLQSLPVVTVGVGFGIDYGLYIVSRSIEEYRISGDVAKAVQISLASAGKAITFTAVALVIATLIWVTSSIRFNSEMGLLLAMWMAISFLGSVTLLPSLLVIFKPKFLTRAAVTAEETRIAERAAPSDAAARSDLS